MLVLNKLQCLYTEKLTLTELFATVIFNWGKTTRQEKKYRLLAFFYITKIVTLKSLFVKMVWCHFDSVAGQHGHKSLMQDLTWLTYQSTHHSLTSEAMLFHQFPAKERRSFNPLTSKSDEHLISLKSFTTKPLDYPYSSAQSLQVQITEVQLCKLNTECSHLILKGLCLFWKS